MSPRPLVSLSSAVRGVRLSAGAALFALAGCRASAEQQTQRPSVTPVAFASLPAPPDAVHFRSYSLTLDAEGRVLSLENGVHAVASGRYGLVGRRVLGIAALSLTEVGFLLDRELAVADGVRVVRYAVEPMTGLAGGGGFAAGLSPGGVIVVRAKDGVAVRYKLPGALGVALGADGSLYAMTARALYRASPVDFGSGAGDALEIVYAPARDELRGLAVSGQGTNERVSFSDGKTRLLLGATAEPSASAPVGAVDEGSWHREVLPVFQRACAACHEPEGAAGVDLSTAAAWEGKRAVISQRVLAMRSMPPEGHPLSEEDRSALARWLQ